MEYIFVVIIGLIIGSFLNSVIYRLKNITSLVTERSHCPLCKHQLGAKDLIPVLSFVFLKGRCRYCQEGIAKQYPIVEILTAALFLMLFIVYGLGLEFIGFALLISFLLVIAVYDMRKMLIVWQVTLPAGIISLGLNIWIGEPASNLIFAIIVGSIFFATLYLVSKGEWVGGGDIQLGAVMGAILSFPLIIWGLIIAYVLGGIYAMYILIFKKRKWKTKIPFGPFLVAGTIISLLFKDLLVEYLYILL